MIKTMFGCRAAAEVGFLSGNSTRGTTAAVARNSRLVIGLIVAPEKRISEFREETNRSRRRCQSPGPRINPAKEARRDRANPGGKKDLPFHLKSAKIAYFSTTILKCP